MPKKGTSANVPLLHRYRSTAKIFRRFALIVAIVPAVIAANAAYSASLINVGPRGPSGPVGLGPRGPTSMSVNPSTPLTGSSGPRFESTIRTDPSGYTATGGGNSGGNSAAIVHKDNAKKKKKVAKRERSGMPPANDRHYISDEVLVEYTGNARTFANLVNQLRLTRLEERRFEALNTTIYRLRITNGRSVPAVINDLEANPAVTAQPNRLFLLQQSASGDPAQYALSKLHLLEAHNLARGGQVTVAVIDSGIDTTHPELDGVIAGEFDALETPEPPHIHGTGIAGIIAAHSRLMGAAPAVRILAIRAFGATEGSTFNILKGLEFAIANNARVINMSFAGAADPAIGREMAAARRKGIVLIAAAGNAGPKSPPLYPAADANVIAVTATDADDKLFGLANHGNYVALAAPGVDILMPTPGANYQLSSGTSMAAAYVTGVAALLIERKPEINPEQLKKILASTARDLGPKGPDSQYGAGLVDAYQAVTSVNAAGTVVSGESRR